MRCLVINLDRSPDRLDRIRSQFEANNVPFERVTAIDGKNYRGHYISNSFCKINNDALTVNEIACFLSHRLCWEKIASGEESHAAVFEDDVVISSRGWAVLQSMPDWLEGVDLLKIETFLGGVFFSRKIKKTSSGWSLLKAHSIHPGGGGYILSKNAAIQILKETEHFLPCAVDNYLFYKDFFPKLCRNIYNLSPAICIQQRLLENNIPCESTIDVTWSTRIQYTDGKKTFLKRILQNFSQPAKRIYYKRMAIPFYD